MFAFAFLLGFLGICSGQDFLATKIQDIWNDMNTNVTDARLTHAEVEQYFHNFGYYSSDGKIQYPNFDYTWHLRYSDPIAVTDYIFKQWDFTSPAGSLSSGDIAILAQEIDTAEASTPGYISYTTEFFPYFQQLYINSPGFGRRL